MDKYDENYADGFRNGWLDASMGTRNGYSLVASEAYGCQGYSEGYYDGQNARMRGEPLPPRA